MAGFERSLTIHLLIDDLDLENGWLYVRNKPAWGWRVKTGNERAVPLITEVVAVLNRLIGERRYGPVFLRQRFVQATKPSLIGSLTELERECEKRNKVEGPALSRTQLASVARTIWRDAGAVKADAVRTSFIRTMRVCGRADATCPKSWRHTFATLLQDANVDPLVRQLTLGHRPSSHGGLGMTANYTHTRPQTQRAQIEQALRRWPQSLELGRLFSKGVDR